MAHDNQTREVWPGDELEAAARAVVASWESGDLAAAVTRLAEALPDEPGRVTVGCVRCAEGYVCARCSDTEETCSRCAGVLVDGDGYDGLCGDCADVEACARCGDIVPEGAGIDELCWPCAVALDGLDPAEIAHRESLHGPDLADHEAIAHSGLIPSAEV